MPSNLWLDAKNCDFYFLRWWIFFVPINLLELCSGMLLLGNNLSFGVLLVWFVWHIHSSLRWIILHYWGRPSWILSPVPENYDSFYSVWGKMQYSQPWVSVGHCFLIFSGYCFPLASSVISHEFIDQYSSECQRGVPCRSLGFTLCISSSSLFYPVDSSPPSLPWPSASSSPYKCSFPALQPGSSPGSTLGQSIGLASPGDHYPLLSGVRCLETVVSYNLSVSFFSLFVPCNFILGKCRSPLESASYHRFLIFGSLAEQYASEGRIGTLVKFSQEEANAPLWVHLTNFPLALEECRRRPPCFSGLCYNEIIEVIG